LANTVVQNPKQAYTSSHTHMPKIYMYYRQLKAASIVN